MMRIIVLIFLLTPAVSPAQPYLYAKAVVGNYFMHDMKELQKKFKTEMEYRNIPAKITSAFPVSLQGEMGVNFTLHNALLEQYFLGGYINYTLTEGRVNYSDYSGSIELAQELVRVGIGAKITYPIKKNLYAYSKMGINISALNLKAKTKIHNAGESSDSEDFTARSINFEPGIQWSKDVRRFRFSASGGYEINYNGKATNADGNYMLNDPGDPLFITWGGFRLGGAVEFRFGRSGTNGRLKTN